MLSRLGTLAVAACLATPALAPAGAQEPKPQGAPAVVSAKAIAEQVGARLQPRDDDELRVGTSFTGVLASPEKLTAIGLKEMHSGARVTITRVAPDKVRLEVDEMSPAPASTSGTFKLDANGALIAEKK
jgi:hypothetical protein